MKAYFKCCPRCGEDTVTATLPIDDYCSVCGEDIRQYILNKIEICEVVQEKTKGGVGED